MNKQLVNSILNLLFSEVSTSMRNISPSGTSYPVSTRTGLIGKFNKEKSSGCLAKVFYPLSFSVRSSYYIANTCMLETYTIHDQFCKTMSIYLWILLISFCKSYSFHQFHQRLKISHHQDTPYHQALYTLVSLRQESVSDYVSCLCIRYYFLFRNLL